MPVGRLVTGPLTTDTQTWRLELDAELAPEVAPATLERAQSMAELLARIPSLSEVTAKPHCEGRFVRLNMAVEARHIEGAIEQAAACMHSCAMTAGLGRVTLVAAGHRSEPPELRG